MPRIAGKISGGMRINGKIVGGMRINGKIVDGFGDTPTPTTLLTINGRTGGQSSPIFAYNQDIVINGVNYGRPTISQRTGVNDVTFVFSSAAIATQFISANPGFQFRFAPTDTIFATLLGAQTGATVEWDLVPLSANTDYVLTFEPLPAVLTLPADIDVVARQLNPAAAGDLSPWTLLARVSTGSRTYNITSIFTHGNGHQIRFASNADAQAFIAADLTVDTGITGQATYKTSVMDNVASIRAAQYRAFPGRYAGGTTYTVTISE